MKTKLTRTVNFGVAFVAILLVFSSTANAQGQRPDPRRTLPQTAPIKQHVSPVAAPHKLPSAIKPHSMNRHEPAKMPQPPHAVKPVPPPKHVPAPVVKPAPQHHEHHAPAPPQVIIVSQAPPKKPSLLEKIIRVFH